MKVKDLISFLLDFNMNSDIVLSVGDTYDDIEDLDLSWGGPNNGDGAEKFDAEYIYINTNYNHENCN